MRNRRFFCKCEKCGATAYASGSVSVHGDGVMTDEVAEIGDFEEWEGGTKGCPHDEHAIIISEVDYDYD